MISQKSNITEVLQQATEAIRYGSFMEAEIHCNAALGLDPDNADAYHLLGVIAMHDGRHDAAREYILKAISRNPAQSYYHNSLGLSYLNQGSFEEAALSFQQALQLKPDSAEMYGNLGNALIKRGQLAEAAAALGQAVALKPDFAEAYNMLGMAFINLEKPEEAIKAFSKLLTIKPDHAEAHYKIGKIFEERGKLKEAVYALEKAIKIKPDYVEAYNSLGNAYFKENRYEDALNAIYRALEINPRHANAYNNLGFILLGLGRIDESIDARKKAVAYNPRSAKFHASLVFALNYQPGITQEEQFKESLRWAEKNAKTYPMVDAVFQNPAKGDRKLKIGYVSADFREHAMAFFIEPLLKSHNRKKFEVYLFSNSLKVDEVTERMKLLADHYYDIAGKKDGEVVEQIRQAEIDILVDLSGHTAENRIEVFAQKAAPVQVSWLGYANTTGLSEIDYLLCDSIVIPEGQEQYYSETLVRLPQTFCCFQPLIEAPDIGDVPARKSGQVTFGCLNNLIKINDEVIGLWAQVLQAVPDSRLLMMGKAAFAEEFVRKRYLKLFNESGIDGSRIEMMPYLPLEDFLAECNNIDIALDPFPFNGNTISCHTMWMGVPVITLPGDRYASRMGASVMNNLGLTDLVAVDKKHYVQIAQTLAENIDYLALLRKELRERMLSSPICDAQSFAQNVEAAYQQMWGACLLSGF